MRNQRYWNHKKLYFLVVCFCLLTSLGGALSAQSLSNRMGKTLNVQQENVYAIDKEIREIEKEMKRAKSATYRNELLMTKLNLESERSNAQLERLNIATHMASFYAGQSQYLLFSLVLLSFFWAVYYGLIRIE
jgi:hypothetical protein